MREEAMTDYTNAERQRRYMAKLKAAAKQQAAVSNGALQARIAELEAELARLKQQAAVSNGGQDWEVRSLRARLLDSQGANRELREQLARAKMPRTESEEFTALQRQLKAARTRIQSLTRDLNIVREQRDAKPTAITKKQRNKLLHALHPDKEVAEERKKALNDALQIFNALKWRVIDD
jgi:hypothetical protein